MTGDPVLVIHLSADSSDAAKALSFVEEITRDGTPVIVMASAETASFYANSEVTTWPDGAPRGLLRLLALVRRISWGQFATIYDFDNSRRTRAYRRFIRPRPRWIVLSSERDKDGTASVR